MEIQKKRRIELKKAISPPFSSAITSLTPEDIRMILQPFTIDQLLDLLQAAALRHPDVLDAIRSVAHCDTTLRKLFIHGLASETTSGTLYRVFSSSGETDEATIIIDKFTGTSKGYGFVTFKHIDGAVRALKEPSKKINGRMTVTQVACSGSSVSDIDLRKIFVGKVPFEISSERLLTLFQKYGEVGRGPLAFDKGSGKSKGFAFFVYETEEGAKACLAEPVKIIDGNEVICKLAAEGKKAKPSGSAGTDQKPQSASLAHKLSSQYGGYGAGYHGGATLLGNNYGMLSSVPPFGYSGGYGYGIGGA